MKVLDYIALAQKYPTLKEGNFSSSIKLNLVTNFTDDLFKKLLVGMCVADDIYPHVWVAPYKQYHFLLKDKTNALYTNDAALTLALFDLNPYLESEFASDEHFRGVLGDLQSLASSTKGLMVVGTFIEPVEAAHGLKEQEGRLLALVKEYNNRLKEWADNAANVYVLDTNALARGLSSTDIRAMRELYAFDMPFAQAFTARICGKFGAYIRARLGRTKKCIVLDLDNVLWGGVVGERGPEGIDVGQEYPGNAYVSFQRALLSLYDRGILLAINSKNNELDVKEVFERNTHMVLTESHFAAMRINWDNKADNIVSLASELNIDPSSMVFLDDDALNRDLVRTTLPEVLVPEFTLPPEEYTPTLLALDVFDPLSVSAEDKERNHMYAAERERKEALTAAVDMGEYLRQLGMSMQITTNDASTVPRVSQLTLKTNQFNLTTRRYTEPDIHAHVRNGSLVYTADVADKFGTYGITNVAIVHVGESGIATLDSFIMSCRVMGRGVEFTLMEHIISELRHKGISTVEAHFIETTKNAPSKDFLPTMGFVEVAREGDTATYQLELPTYAGHRAPFVKDAISITTIR